MQNETGIKKAQVSKLRDLNEQEGMYSIGKDMPEQTRINILYKKEDTLRLAT